MACPERKNFSGSDGYVDASYKKSRAAAAAAARALVPRAAQSSCIQQALAEGHCPPDCPFPNASNVQYTIDRVTTHPHTLVNISPYGWFIRIFDGHWLYHARAYYSYRGFVGCTRKRIWLALADDAVVEEEVAAA